MKLYVTFYNKAAKIPFLVSIKKWIDSCELALFYLRRKFRKFLRIYSSHGVYIVPTKKICILCVKRSVYVDAAIANINSLHYFNSNYRCQIYCDNKCFSYFNSIKNKLDYPQQVIIINAYKTTTNPWQQYKYETIVKISRENGVLVDADRRWFDEPVIEDHKLMFLCPAYRV